MTQTTTASITSSRYLKADENVSPGRIYKYLYQFKTLCKKFIDFEMKTATKDEMQYAIGGLQTSEYSDHAKKDFKTALKKFFRTLYEDEWDRPERVQRILAADFMKNRGSTENKRETDLLTPDDVPTDDCKTEAPSNKILPEEGTTMLSSIILYQIIPGDTMGK